MLAIQEDREGHYFSYAKDLRDLSTVSAVPIYGMWGAILLGRGVLGGLMNDPDNHGQDVADLALRILAGENASEIPIVAKARYEPAFDYAQMQRFGVSLDQIPSDSNVLDKPTPFYFVSPAVVWAVAAVIAVLSMSTLFLLGHLRQRRRLHSKDKELRASERLFRAVFNQKTELAKFVTPDGMVTDVNDRSLGFFGRDRPQVVGQPLWDTPGWEHNANLQAKLRSAVTRAAAGEFVRFETEHPHPSGGMATVDFSLTPISNGSGTVVTLFAEGIDISEDKLAASRLKEAEHRAHEAEKLASIATLTAGIAHDVGAPMTAILGYAEMLQTSLTDEKNRKRASIIVEQVSRVTELVQALLNMARPGESAHVPLDPAKVLEASIEFYREMLINRGISVQREVTAVPAVVGDPNRLQQAFLSVLVNAADAMRGGGTLRVCLRSPSPKIVEISIEDSGVGIAPDQLAHIFEPFYTTKLRGQGTGLGLMVAKSIIDEHGGTMAAQSTLGEGTTFTIRLPCAEG